MDDKRSLSEIAARQSMDWDRYAGALRTDVARAVRQYPANSAVQSLGDHIPLLLDEIDALRHDIRRAYDIANEYLNETISLRQGAGEHLTRLRESADGADRGEGVSLKGLSRDERRKLLSVADESASGTDRPPSPKVPHDSH